MGPGDTMGRLGDRFVLLRELGPGGMSRVFLGRDEVLDRPVAVKVVNPDPNDPQAGLRFRREGRAAARLSHPNIVRVFDAGEDEFDGREVSYIVMEYVSGGDFKDLMDRCGPLPENLLSRVGADVAAGLAHAHERGIIHRDIKPHNILLDERGSPKLADFGIARALDGTTSHNRPGAYLGTAAYSSPEQLCGERVTPKSDVYSLGATLSHAASGEPPFSGNSIEVANQHISEPPVSPRARGAQIGADLEALILDCLAKDPHGRPDAARLRDRLLENGAAGGVGSRRPRKRGGVLTLDEAAEDSRGFRPWGLRAEAGRSGLFSQAVRAHDKHSETYFQGWLAAENDAGCSRGRASFVAVRRRWRLGSVWPGRARRSDSWPERRTRQTGQGRRTAERRRKAEERS